MVGLAGQYNERYPPVVNLVRRLAVLPLLKLADIIEGYNYAAQTRNDATEDLVPKMNELLDYVRQTWIDDNARFPPHIWSRFDVEGKSYQLNI